MKRPQLNSTVSEKPNVEVKNKVGKKVTSTLVHVLRLCTRRTVHRGSRHTALLFHDHGTRRG